MFITIDICEFEYIYIHIHIYIYSFISFSHKSGSVVSELSALVVSRCMSPTRSEYRELGLELVELGESTSCCPKKPQMVGEEKRDDGAGDPIKILLEEALMRQRNEMMDSFAQILLRMPTPSSASSMSNRFGDATPFKVQVNFDIPLFEGNIDIDSLDNWLNVLEGYFSGHNFYDREKITFALLKAVPNVKKWWET